MASYGHIEKDGSLYIGSAEGVEYVVKGRRGNWRASLRSNTALGVGETAPEAFYADTLQEVDAQLGEIASKIAAHRAKARKARHRVDVYAGGDEPAASYPFKTEAAAQWNFDYTSRRADEGVEMRLFLNGKEVERHTQPEKKRRSPRKPNTGRPAALGYDDFIAGRIGRDVFVACKVGLRGTDGEIVYPVMFSPIFTHDPDQETDVQFFEGHEMARILSNMAKDPRCSVPPLSLFSQSTFDEFVALCEKMLREDEEERGEAERRYGNRVHLRSPNPPMTEIAQAKAEIAKVAASIRLWKRPAAKRSVMATHALAKPAIQAVKEIARSVYGDPPTLRWDIERSKIAIAAIRDLVEEEAYLRRVLEQKTVTENDVSNASGILYNLERTLLRVIAFCLPPEY